MKRILILFLAVLYSLTLYNALKAQYLINENTLAITEVKPINLHFCNKIDSIISNTIINYETPVNNLRSKWTLDSTIIDTVKSIKYDCYVLFFEISENGNFLISIIYDKRHHWGDYYYIYNNKMFLIYNGVFPANYFYKTNKRKYVKYTYFNDTHIPFPKWILTCKNNILTLQSFYIDNYHE